MDTIHAQASTPTPIDMKGKARRELFDAASRVLSWHARRTQEAQRRWLAQSGFAEEAEAAPTTRHD